MEALFDVGQTKDDGGKSNEWYTPSRYIEAARAVMGGIDLDPASCSQANQIVRAKNYYTEYDDGLKQPWYGRVWNNPPYKSEVRTTISLQAMWVNKALTEYSLHHITQAILLVTGVTERKWFQPLWNFLICFPDHQLRFRMMDSSKFTHPYGSCFVYLGSDEAKFIEIFSQFGVIAKRVNPPTVRPTERSLWDEQEEA